MSEYSHFRGRFSVSFIFFDDLKPGEGVSLFDGMVVLNAQRNYMRGCVDYIAIHESFNEFTPPGTQMNEYTPVWKDGNASPVKWVLKK